MQERKIYKVELTETQKDRFDKLLEFVGVDYIKLKEIEQNNKTVEEEEFPQSGDTYWYYDEYGVSYDIFQEYNEDIKRLRIGNCFKTKEEAEFELERLEVIAEMKKFAEPENSIWDGNVAHCYICWNSHRSIMINVNYEYKSDLIYFLSSEIAQKCIDSVGEDRIKKYYLRVEE